MCWSILEPFSALYILPCKLGTLVVFIFILRWKYVLVKATSHEHSVIVVSKPKHLTLLGTDIMSLYFPKGLWYI